MALSAKQETDLVTKLEEMFQSALERGKTGVRPSPQSATATAKAINGPLPRERPSKKRRQPETVNNQVSVTINRLVGQFVRQKYRIRYQGRNAEQDQLGAEALSDIMLFIRQINGLEFEERDQVDEGFTGGFGVLECGVTWDDTLSAGNQNHQRGPFRHFP